MLSSRRIVLSCNRTARLPKLAWRTLSLALILAAAGLVQLAPLALPQPARGQSLAESPDRESYLRLHYTKEEHLIPMRDGTKLFTTVFRAARYHADLPDPDEANAVCDRPVWRRQVSQRRSARAITS